MSSVLTFLAGVVSFVASQAGFLSILPHGVQAAIGVIGTLLAALGIRSSSSAPTSVTALLDSLGKGWKTVAGIVVAIVAVLLSPDVAGVMPAGVAHVVQLIGEALTALGLYHANATAPK